MRKRGRPSPRQMLNELDRTPLRPAEQFLEPPLALDQRQVAQIDAVMLDQIERVQHRLMAAALAPQRMEVRRPVVASDLEAIQMREKAKRLPAGAERDELLKKARRLDVASELDNWLSSPGLKPPS
jgi:hypothetical protein